MGTPFREFASAHDTGGSVGSGDLAEPRFVAIGRILRPHGVHGEVVVEVMTDFPERLDSLQLAYLGDSMQADPYHVISSRWHGDRVVLAFEGYPDRTSAGALRGLLVQIPVEDVRPLPQGEYYPYQLVGLDVVTVTGEDLGRVSDVLFAGPNDVYVVNGPRGEILLPAIRQVIRQIDLPAGRMTVELMPGLAE